MVALVRDGLGERYSEFLFVWWHRGHWGGLPKKGGLDILNFRRGQPEKLGLSL